MSLNRPPPPQETTYRNYHRIRLRPEQFPSYLTSPEVGFASYELLGTPQHTAKGGGRGGGGAAGWSPPPPITFICMGGGPLP